MKNEKLSLNNAELKKGLKLQRALGLLDGAKKALELPGIIPKQNLIKLIDEVLELLDDK